MIRFRTFAWLLLALCCAGVSSATDDGTRGELSADVVKERTTQLLSQLQWHTDLEAAFALAREEQKPLLWIQMVGDLDGGL